MLNDLKREALALGRGLTEEFRQRRTSKLPPWEYFRDNPMEIGEAGERHDDPVEDAGEEVEESGAEHSAEGDVDMREVESMPLRDFLAMYHEDYVTDSRFVARQALICICSSFPLQSFPAVHSS